MGSSTLIPIVFFLNYFFTRQVAQSFIALPITINPSIALRFVARTSQQLSLSLSISLCLSPCLSLSLYLYLSLSVSLCLSLSLSLCLCVCLPLPFFLSLIWSMHCISTNKNGNLFTSKSDTWYFLLTTINREKKKEFSKHFQFFCTHKKFRLSFY